MPCIFCDIVGGRAGGAIVGRRDGATAFLDVRPVFKGHVLVVPDEHVETMLDADGARVGRLFAVAREVAGAVTRALDADGTFVACNNTISQSVPHLHVHVVPRRKGDGLRGFFWPRTKYEQGEIDAYRDRIAAAWETT